MFKVIITVLVISILFGCGLQRQVVSVSVIQDGRYDSEFPVVPTSDQLKQISATVKLISSLTFYSKYFFSQSTQLTVQDLYDKTFHMKANSRAVVEMPASGTGTIIYADSEKLALLTCAHTIYAPDTIITYFQDAKGHPTIYVESIAVKVRQTINVIGLPNGEKIEVLANDTENDIAILGRRLKSVPKIPIPIFSYPWGVSNDLEWGTFVYMFGFPHGKQIVTNAMVSHPNRNEEHDFIINATMFKGVSGGPIIAIRDGAPNFELIGIANALSANQKIAIRPNPDIEKDSINPTQAYQGDLFLEREYSIIHGLTFAISMESIKNFMREYKNVLEEQGYFIKLVL